MNTSCSRPDSRRSMRVGLGRVLGLVHDLAVAGDGRVGGQHELVLAAGHRPRLELRQPTHERLGRLAVERRLVHVGDADLELVAGGGQQGRTAW